MIEPWLLYSSKRVGNEDQDRLSRLVHWAFQNTMLPLSYTVHRNTLICVKGTETEKMTT